MHLDVVLETKPNHLQEISKSLHGSFSVCDSPPLAGMFRYGNEGSNVGENLLVEVLEKDLSLLIVRKSFWHFDVYFVERPERRTFPYM